MKAPSFLCANKKTLRYKLNDYIHTINLKDEDNEDNVQSY